jgi:hypothetical protein
MVARMGQTVEVQYPKHWFLTGTMVCVPATVVIIYLAATAKEDFAMAVWGIVGALFGAWTFLFIVPPLFTHYLAGEKGLRIRMGLLINTTIPYTWIREVKETAVKRGALTVGIGVRYSPIMETAFVISSFGSLVTLKLEEPFEVGGILKHRVSTIVLSVRDKPSFMAMIRQRAALPGE